MRNQNSQWVHTVHGGRNLSEAITSHMGPMSGSPAPYTRTWTNSRGIPLNQPTWAHTHIIVIYVPLCFSVELIDCQHCLVHEVFQRESRVVSTKKQYCCSHYNHARDIRKMLIFHRTANAAQPFRETAKGLLHLIVVLPQSRDHMYACTCPVIRLNFTIICLITFSDGWRGFFPLLLFIVLSRQGAMCT